MYKTGFIGLGNMGSAIAKGLKASHPEISLFGYDCNAAAMNTAASVLTTVSSELDVVRSSELIILAVKPDVILKTLETIKSDLNGKIVVSIAAGVTIEAMESVAGKTVPIIRVMPNTPALIQKGMSVLSPNQSVTGEMLDKVQETLSSIGKTLVLPEKNIDAVTAISGCGPAYIFTLIQAMADAGVKLGLQRKDALLLASQTVTGSAEMVLSTGQDPIPLRNMVTSPGGSTIAAVHTLERAAFSGIIIDAVEQAAITSAKLGMKK